MFSDTTTGWTNRVLKVSQFAPEKIVLDCFTNQGGFALSCSLNGANSVTAIDISDKAIQTAQNNAHKSGAKQIEWLQANVFDELKTCPNRGDRIYQNISFLV